MWEMSRAAVPQPTPSLPKWPSIHQCLSPTNYPKLAAPHLKGQLAPRSPTPASPAVRSGASDVGLLPMLKCLVFICIHPMVYSL
jgi:hypothetical protein